MKIMLNEARRNSSLKSIKECENKIEKLIIKIAYMKEYTEIDFSKSIFEAEERIKELKECINVNKTALKNGYIIFGEN